jgi:hypothetical protein
MVIGRKGQQIINNKNKNSKEWKTTLNEQKARTNETRKKKVQKKMKEKINTKHVPQTKK